MELTRKAKESRDFFLFTTICHLHCLILTRPSRLSYFTGKAAERLGSLEEDGRINMEPPGEASKVFMAWEAPKHVMGEGT